MSSERSAWEYADGPEVGPDVPITSEPRAEVAPGVPEPPARPISEDEGPTEFEERKVKVADPALDPGLNERLTEEVQDALGTEQVRVPKDRPHPSRGDRAQTTGLVAEMRGQRLTILMLLAVFITIGAIVSLVSGSWWLLPVAVGVHALGTIVVTSRALRLTTVSEHASPTTSAMLEEEGIRNPDEHFSALVQEFSENEHGDAGDVVSSDKTERSSASTEDPARATAEQSSAMTPTAEASQPTDGGGVADALMWSTVGALLLISFIVPVTAGGGAMWILPVVMVPLLVAWVVVQTIWKRAK